MSKSAPKIGLPAGVTPPKGWARSPGGSVKSPPVHLERCEAANTTHRGKQKQHKKEITQTPRLPASKKDDQRPERPQGHEFRENPKNAQGQKRTPEKPQEQGGRAAKRAGPKRDTAAQGAKKNKKQDQKRAGGRCACDLLLPDLSSPLKIVETEKKRKTGRQNQTRNTSNDDNKA